MHIKTYVLIKYGARNLSTIHLINYSPINTNIVMCMYKNMLTTNAHGTRLFSVNLKTVISAPFQGLDL